MVSTSLASSPLQRTMPLQENPGPIFCSIVLCRRCGQMAEVLTQFADPVAGPDGHAYRAQACGGPMPDGVWEGWIEFAPVGGGTPLRSPRETTQPNRKDAVYWATGLTAIYLEGALDRALN